MQVYTSVYMTIGTGFIYGNYYCRMTAKIVLLITSIIVGLLSDALLYRAGCGQLNLLWQFNLMTFVE